MAPAKSTASPTPGPSTSKTNDVRPTAAALYNWCQANFDEGHILSQNDLLGGDIIPNKDMDLLMKVVQSLIDQRLFRTHELRTGGIGWKIESQANAEKYKDLSSDESLVYSVIETAGRAGAWLKNIKTKLNLHQKNLDNSIKTLTQRGHIKPMSTVKYPNRKMYILAGLQPNEDATGGPWFTDGVLDQELLDQLASQLEWKISQMSWKQITDNKDHLTGPDNVQSRKRKEPDAGFEHDQAKEKTRRKDAEDAAEALIDRNHHGSSSAKQKTLPQTSSKAYVPHPAGYRKYPTLRELTDFVNKSRFVREDIPEANMSQLLDIMAYDDRIIKITSSDGSTPIMYKARRTIPAIEVERQFKEGRLDEDARMNAIRDFEVAKLGNGGITEIPCGRCPVFDMCEVGGPVNPSNCVYFEEWFEKLESGLSW